MTPVYLLIDAYDEIEVIGYANDGKTAYEIFCERILETDGECCLIYRPKSGVDIYFEKVLKAALQSAWADFEDGLLDE